MRPARATRRREEAATGAVPFPSYDDDEGEAEVAEGEPGWSEALFSPVLKFFGGVEESKGKDPALTPSTEGSSASETLTPVNAGTPPQARAVAPSYTPAAGGAITQCSLTSPALYAHEASDSPSSGSREHAAYSGRRSETTPSSADMSEAEEELEEFNPYSFIKSLPAYETVAPKIQGYALPRKPRRSPNLSLVLDLDETLVHCSIEPIDDADLRFPVDFNGEIYQVYARKRPYLDHFLEVCSRRYEVTVFTASQKVYAEKLLDLLDPEGRLIKYRLYRDTCLNVEGNFLKDLTVLGRDLTATVLVDNSPHAFGYQVDNGIPIESWFDDPTDTELLKLMNFLPKLDGVVDVRDVVRAKFQLHKLIEAST